jgi:putative ABC transport system permease protein
MVPCLPVSSGFFETMHIPLRAGRFPSAHPKTREAVVNQQFADRFLPGENAVGRVIDIGGPMEVVGVVGNTRIQGPISADRVEVYWSTEDFGDPTLLVRVAGPPESIASAIRDRLKRVDPEIRLGTVRPLIDMEADRTAVQRFTRSLLSIFAVLAVVLASLGIYGVVSYTVAQRTREIGIRMALGADRGSVARLVLGQTAGATVAGAAIGAVGADLLAKFLATQLYGIGAHDPFVLGGVVVLIASVAMGACAIPMQRASKIDPAACLRD